METFKIKLENYNTDVPALEFGCFSYGEQLMFLYKQLVVLSCQVMYTNCQVIRKRRAN